MIYTKLMDHQKKIVNFCLSKNYFGIFADYGTGKTLCALYYINYLKISKVLVISTKTAVQSTWVDEIKTHTDFIYTSLLGTKSQKIKNLYFGLRKSRIVDGYYSAEKKSIVCFLLNFDGVENIFNELIQANFDFVIIDECFPAGTKILTKNGEKNIEDINVGDYVYNAIGLNRVKRIANREVDKLTKLVLSNGRYFECTPEHLIFTENGWQKAYSIVEGTVVYGKEKMSELWKKNTTNKSKILGYKALQLLLLSEMENKDLWGVEQRYPNEKKFTDEIKQNIKSNETSATNFRWQWKRFTNTTKEIIKSFRKELGCRISCKNKANWFEKIFALLFKSRYSKFKENDSNRSRWRFTFWFNWAKKWQKKNKETRVIRVESIKVSEQTNNGQFKNVRRDSTTVYNLEIENHPSFFVEGILVHNSTKIKSPDTKRTKVLWKLAEYIPKRCIMTGFPVTESIGDFYSQIKFLDLGETFGKSWYAFMGRYFTKVMYRYVIRKKSITEILQKLQPFCIRITNTELNLPPKVYKIEHVEQTETQAKLLLSLKDYFQLEFGKVKIDTEYIFSLINKSLQICAGFIKDDKNNVEKVPTNKDERLAEILEEINIYEKKVIIWCSYLNTVSKLKNMLKQFNPLILTGATKDVNELVQTFQHNKKRNVLIAIQKKGAASITLTSCNYAIYYSNSWSFDDRGNSEARIYRKGSEIHQHVTYVDLVTRNSVEDQVLACLKTKKNLVDELKKQFI